MTQYKIPCIKGPKSNQQQFAAAIKVWSRVHMLLNALNDKLQPGVIATKCSHLSLREETTVAGRADLQLQTYNPGLCYV
jgi:hypothetical protein